MKPDDLKMKRAKKVVDAGLGPKSIELALLSESILLNEKFDTLLSKEDLVIPPFPEYPEYTMTDLSKTEELLALILKSTNKETEINVTFQLV